MSGAAGGAAAAVERLLAGAVEATGLDDFGDASFRDGLDVLAASVLEEAEPNAIGLAAFEGQVAGALRNRLRVVDWHRRHPELAATPVAVPIVIAGIPRTGTTALSHLLACDPRNRSLMGWEASDSVPPPEAATFADDPRFVAAREAGAMLDLVNPGFKAIHHDPPDKPFECVTILTQHFDSALFPTLFNVPSYDAWMVATDARPAYAYHRSVLQVLQSRCPGRWQLKSPHHALAVDALHATYPDVRLVVTHRDPVRAVASVLSLVTSLSGTFSDADHRAYIASHWPGLLGEMSNRLVDFRARHPEVVVHDMPYRELVDDPVGAVRRMYASFGEELSDGAAAAMQADATAHPQGEYGRHEYRLGEFGLTRGDVEPLFARYLAAHDVEREEA